MSVEITTPPPAAPARTPPAAEAIPPRLLYPTAEAAVLLGMHPRDVLRLIHDRKLKAVREVVRGTGRRPRLKVSAAAIAEYVASLKPAHEPPPPKRARAPRLATPAAVRRELERLPHEYYPA